MCLFSSVYGFGTLYTNSSDCDVSVANSTTSRLFTDAPSAVIPKTYCYSIISHKTSNLALILLCTLYIP